MSLVEQSALYQAMTNSFYISDKLDKELLEHQTCLMATLQVKSRRVVAGNF